ncbi:MAG: RNA 3'-terminal phosphate cyclase, partial [Nitrososphaerales archaeon]
EHGPFIGGDSIGEKGKTAEKVGSEAAAAYISELKSQAPIDSHLSDMLIPLLSLSLDESRFRVSRITDHLLTNLRLSSVLSGLTYDIEADGGKPPLISMKPGRARP